MTAKEIRNTSKIAAKWNLPFGIIVEGTGSIQCICPRCEYSRGFNTPFLAPMPVAEVVECKTCGLTFIAATLGDVGIPLEKYEKDRNKEGKTFNLKKENKAFNSKYTITSIWERIKKTTIQIYNLT